MHDSISTCSLDTYVKFLIELILYPKSSECAMQQYVVNIMELKFLYYSIYLVYIIAQFILDVYIVRDIKY